MSGPFGSSQWMYQSAAGFYPFAIDQSLRFNDDDTAYLSRTPASVGSRTTWTWSAWVKRGNIDTTQDMFSATVALNDTSWFRFLFDANDKIQVHPTYNIVMTSDAVFRDASAWYHIVLAVDTTQATSSDRVKVYVNNSQITFSGASYPAQNHTTPINNTVFHAIGRYPWGGSFHFDGYMAEINFIDGQALDAFSFGEFKSSVWVAKEYTGSYGTNGFRLSFADSSNIGDDTSGNTNDWTANSLVATDVLLDSPTNNFATWNPLDRDMERDTKGLMLFAEGNLFAQTSEGLDGVRSTFWIGPNQGGKYYFEMLIANVTNTVKSFGLASEVDRYNNGAGGELASGGAGLAPALYADGRLAYNNTLTSGFGPTYAKLDIVGVAVDCDNEEVYFSKNNAWVDGNGGTTTFANAANAASSGLADIVTPFAGLPDNSRMHINAGQDSSFAGNKTRQGNTDDNGIGDFYYAPPSGYLALCTANLPDPAIDPAKDDVPADYFNTVLWTGTDTSAGRSITGVGFQPDFVFSKSRNDAFQWNLYDSVRGAAARLKSNTTGAEETNATYGYLSSFDNDGFTTAAGATNNENWNKTSSGYVAWNWLAGNGTSSNTDGSITSTVSVNQKAGFSIVSYSGVGSSAGATVGHGLSQAPELILPKVRNRSGDSWHCYHSSLGGTKGILLNATNVASTDSGFWNNTDPTSSVITLGTYNVFDYDYIAYCFAEVEGYSKFGSYTGNGSTDGPFVYTGFRPAFVMYKAASGTAYNWGIYDTARDTYNVAVQNLAPNNTDADTNYGGYMDILSNGFKCRASGNLNENGSTYIYAAFAENPFKYANAR